MRLTGQPAAVLASLLCVAVPLAQPPAAPPAQGSLAQDLKSFTGRRVAGVDIQGLRRLSKSVALASLGTRKGKRLSPLVVQGDLSALWKGLKIEANVRVRAVDAAKPDSEVLVTFVVTKEYPRYETTVFKGLGHFTEEQVRGMLGDDEVEQLTEITADSLARRLEERYDRDGYPFCKVTVRVDDKQSMITLLVDEGPNVKVRSLDFRGNEAFPDTSILGLTWNLMGSAKLKGTPGFLGDAPFSRKVLAEDLDRLRRFYRAYGYKDALAEVYDLRWFEDRTGVDIVIRIFEGPLYRIDSVAIEVEGYPDAAAPEFKPEDLAGEIKVAPGDPVTQDAIQADMRRLALFYGKRGFPSRDEYPGLGESSFRVQDPVEVVDPERSRIKLIYRVREGKRKRLRQVRITGNRYTRDAVVRRSLSVMPGDWLDMEELAKSRDRLLGSQYFGDYRIGDQGVHLRLKPVAGEDEFVDLEVAVKDGTTGQILWGGGFSSSAGLFGNVQYRKRNFDWRRSPTGWNPIDWFAQLLDNRAFHGGGQTLYIDLQPGTVISAASADFFEPDLLGGHLDTIGLGLNGSRWLRGYDSYRADLLSAGMRLMRKFGHDLQVTASMNHQRVNIADIEADAPAIVWDAEGRNVIRSIGLSGRYTDVDAILRPTKGVRLSGYFTVSPEWLGSDERFWKAGAAVNGYVSVHRDSRGRAHVIELRARLNHGEGIQGDSTLPLTERFFMGGQGTLRGFDFRGAGPTQFGHPTGGRTQLLSGVEWSFPLFSTRPEGAVTETELIRGVGFFDAGMLGEGFDDPLFRQTRVSVGVGVRVLIPGLGGLPIALDLSWPLYRQESDDRQVFSFSFKFN